jgi:hypothetical protein
MSQWLFAQTVGEETAAYTANQAVVIGDGSLQIETKEAAFEI